MYDVNPQELQAAALPLVQQVLDFVKDKPLGKKVDAVDFGDTWLECQDEVVSQGILELAAAFGIVRVVHEDIAEEIAPDAILWILENAEHGNPLRHAPIHWNEDTQKFEARTARTNYYVNGYELKEVH